MTRDKVFISYSHRDRKWLTRLQKMLKPLVRRGVIELWDDTAITPGAEWRRELAAGLASARVAVLLVSADFLASDFIAHNELPPLLRAAQQHGVTILWVYLSPCLYDASEIDRFQAAHDVKRSLAEMTVPKRQRTLLEISKEIRRVFDEEPSRAAHGQGAGGVERAAVTSVALEALSGRAEAVTLPDRGDGIGRVLSLHLGPTAVVGRCYASQLRRAAAGALDTLGEERVHWVVGWDDERLNQLIARLSYRRKAARHCLRIENLTGYSARPQSFTVTAEADAAQPVASGEKVDQTLRPGAALSLTTGVDSGRQELLRLASRVADHERSLLAFRAEASFLFPPTAGDEATLVRFLGAWVPQQPSEIAASLSADAKTLEIPFPNDDLRLSIQLDDSDLRLVANGADLAGILRHQGEPA